MTLFKPEQKENAAPPMDVTELGMVTLDIEVHSQNTQLPILVTEFGMVTLFRAVQSENNTAVRFGNSINSVPDRCCYGIFIRVIRGFFPDSVTLIQK